MTDKYGWRSQFWCLFAFWIFVELLVVFVCPETSFHRGAQYDRDLNYTSEKSEDSIETSEEPLESLHADHDVHRDDFDSKRSYLEELLPYRQIPGSPGLILATVHFFVTGLYPIVWYTFIILGSYLSWYIGINVTLAQVFGSPPISFSPTQLGFVNAFGLPGALAAELLLHALSDRSCKWLARRHGNIHEPEFRLVLMVPAILVFVLASTIYGWYAGVVAQYEEIS